MRFDMNYPRLPRVLTPALWLTLIALSPVLRAEEPAPAPTDAAATAPDPETARKYALLTPKQGVFALGSFAELKTGAKLGYISPEGADLLLYEVWGNPRPKHSRVLGLITPANFNVMNPSEWVVVVTYEDSGHIKDDDAASIDYAELLKTMKDGTAADNAARVKEGYPSVELIGWAETPRYDAAAKKMFWAKELKFGGQPEGATNTLNYDLRVLGRQGVLNLNAVADIRGLASVKAATPDILNAVEFKSGQRYADYNESTDRTATYGLAALVAGGVAAKSGVLKGLLAILIAGKKFFIIGFIALATKFKSIWAWVRGRFSSSQAE